MQKRILLIDDESSLRRSLSVSMVQEGFDVEPCENGIHALKKLYQYKQSNISLDTVVIDIKLPDIDGIKLGKIIRSKYSNVNIVFITGYSDKLNIQEIQTMSTTGFLEKPFTASDLTYKINEISRNKGKDIYVAVEKPVEKIKTYSAYALLKIDKNANFFEIYRRLYFDKNVLYCDATQGDYDIFLLVQASCLEEFNEICEKSIKKIAGINEIDLLSVERPVIDESLRNIVENSEKFSSSEISVVNKRELDKRVCSYVLLEVEREKIEDIYPTLLLDDKIVYCDFTSGKYNLVLLVYGNYYTDIDEFIEYKISTLNGVLKIKEFPIVNIFEM